MESLRVLQAKTTIGIDVLKEKHGIETNYQLQKRCGLSSKSVDTIQVSGGITKNTLFKIGIGLGYGNDIEDFDDIVIAVMNDMASRDLTELQVIRKANKIIRHINSSRRKPKSVELQTTGEFIEVTATKRSLEARKAVCGIGINDADYIVTTVINGKMVSCPYYLVWTGMINRCYNLKYQEKYPTYKDCSVTKEWLTFANFKEWMKTKDWKGMELDKDILTIGNKTYSPESCIFVSRRVNNLLNDSAATRGNNPQGVTFDKRLGKYRAQCSVNGKQRRIGVFATSNDAELAYLEFKSKAVTSVAESEGGLIGEGLLRHANLFKKRAEAIKNDN